MSWSISDVDYVDICMLRDIVDIVLNMIKAEKRAMSKNSKINRF